MKSLRWLFYLLLAQLVFHVIITFIYSNSYLEDKACVLNTCMRFDDNLILAVGLKFTWFFQIVTSLLIIIYNRFFGFLLFSLSGLVIACVFGNFNNESFDLVVIFGISALATPLNFHFFKDRKTSDGIPIPIFMTISVFILTFPLAWILRSVFLGGSVSSEWELALWTGSILSVFIAIFIPVAFLTKGTGEQPFTIPKSFFNIKLYKPTNSYIVSAIYFISLFFNQNHLENVTPLVLFLEIFVFWAILFPIFRSGKSVIKEIMLILYLVLFHLCLDIIIFQMIQVFLSDGNFIIVITDYVIIIIYLASFPVLKTLPEYLFLKRKEGKSYLDVLRSNFPNEMLILLLILVKMNLLYYQLH